MVTKLIRIVCLRPTACVVDASSSGATYSGNLDMNTAKVINGNNTEAIGSTLGAPQRLRAGQRHGGGWDPAEIKTGSRRIIS